MVQLQVVKPSAILFDVSGTVAKSSFIDKVLMPYVKDWVRVYFEENFDHNNVQVDIENLRTQAAIEASGAPQIPKEGDRKTMIEAAVKFVQYCIQHRLENKALSLLRFHMWFDGYKRERLETPVYSDVAIQLQKWRTDNEIKLYVFSNGWSEATRRFLARTNHGNLNLLIEDHFDTQMGSLTDEATYAKLLQKLKLPANKVLFLTKSAEEGRVANKVGLIVVLVLTHRRNIEKLTEADRKAMPRVRSFNEIEFIAPDSLETSESEKTEPSDKGAK